MNKISQSKWWLKIKTYTSKYRSEVIVLAILLVIGATLRFYNFSDSLMFQADQARDVLVVSQIFRDLDPVFIGPVTSVGNMYLGPLYYYMMLLPLFLSYPSPMGPAIMITLLSLTTIALTYFLGKKLVGNKGALWAAGAMSFSWISIQYSRFSWNPNPASFFMILLLYFLYIAWRQKRYWAWVGAIITLGCLTQLHYVNLLAVAASGIIWLLCLWDIFQTGRKKIELLPITDEELLTGDSPKKSNLTAQQLKEKLMAKPSSKRAIDKIKIKSNPNISMENNLKKFLQMTGIGILITGLMFVPLFLFDLRHGALNIKSAANILVQEKGFSATTTKMENPIIRSLAETHGRSQHIIGDVGFAPNSSTWGKTLLVLIVLTYLVYLASKKEASGKVRATAIILVTFLIISILGISFYKHSVFNHYILFAQVVVFLSYGLILSDLWTKKIWGKVLTICFCIAFLFFNIAQYDFSSQSLTWKQIREISASIYEKIGDTTPYNLVLIGPSKDDNATNYRYFMSSEQNRPLTPDKIGETEKLVIIDETQDPNFDWRYSDKYEIVVFKAERDANSWQPIPNGPIIHILEK